MGREARQLQLGSVFRNRGQAHSLCARIQLWETDRGGVCLPQECSWPNVPASARPAGAARECGRDACPARAITFGGASARIGLTPNRVWCAGTHCPKGISLLREQHIPIASYAMDIQPDWAQLRANVINMLVEQPAAVAIQIPIEDGVR